MYDLKTLFCPASFLKSLKNCRSVLGRGQVERAGQPDGVGNGLVDEFIDGVHPYGLEHGVEIGVFQTVMTAFKQVSWQKIEFHIRGWPRFFRLLGNSKLRRIVRTPAKLVGNVV